jgi:hypothetical protein
VKNRLVAARLARVTDEKQRGLDLSRVRDGNWCCLGDDALATPGEEDQQDGDCGVPGHM